MKMRQILRADNRIAIIHWNRGYNLLHLCGFSVSVNDIGVENRIRCSYLQYFLWRLTSASLFLVICSTNGSCFVFVFFLWLFSAHFQVHFLESNFQFSALRSVFRISLWINLWIQFPIPCTYRIHKIIYRAIYDWLATSLSEAIFWIKKWNKKNFVNSYLWIIIITSWNQVKKKKSLYNFITWCIFF